MPFDAASNLADSAALCAQERDLFSFSKQQVAARKREQVSRRHAAIFAEPSRPKVRRYARMDRRLLAL
jgi:hypothetical protein